jgi:hypothetical protein
MLRAGRNSDLDQGRNVGRWLDNGQNSISKKYINLLFMLSGNTKCQKARKKQEKSAINKNSGGGKKVDNH